jgi:protein-tyrosine phosphatase
MLAAGDEPAVAGPRSVLVGAVVNARDLGGIPLTDDAAVADGVLFRGPPLANLSSDGCEQVAALGVRTVIDLREEAERTSKPSAPCVQEQAASVLAPLPIPYSVSPTDYLADLNTDTSMVEVFRTLGDADAYPVYFHCTWGRDRTAVLAAVILLALGADRDAIMDDYLLSRATVGAYPESLEAVLDEVEARGGVDAFLTDAGVDEEWVATLRATAVSAP